MSTQIQPTPIVTGEKAKEIEKLLKTKFSKKDIEKGKQKLEDMFKELERGTNSHPYLTIISKDDKKEIPTIDKDKIEQFKKDLEKYHKETEGVE